MGVLAFELRAIGEEGASSADTWGERFSARKAPQVEACLACSSITGLERST